MDTKTSILIVDDDLNFRKTLSGILRARGYAPIAAATGKAALDRVEEEAPAVALIDLKLEDISGLELMSKINECCPATECIVLTGYASQKSAIEAVNLGAYSYMQKPYDMEQLLVTVRRAIEKREAVEALRESEELLRATLESTADGILVVDEDGKTLHANARFSEMWRIPQSVLDSRDDDMLLDFVLDQLQDPEAFLAKVRFLYGTSAEDFDTLEFKDGRAYERFSRPLLKNGATVGRVWSFRDITKRKRAEEALRQYTAQLEALRQMGLELTAQLDLDALLHSIASQAVELLGGTIGGLDIYRPDRDVLEWTASVGLNSAPSSTVIRRGEGLSGQVWETGEPLIVDDYHRWEERVAGFEDYPFMAVVGVPVRWGEEFLGVLEVMAESPHIFSPADAELLSLFATQAAIAIQRARLYEETRSRAERLAVVNRIARAVGAILDLDDLLETVYQEVTSVFQADAFFIALYDEEANELDFRIQVDEGVREPPGRRALEDGLTSRVIAARKPLLIRDLEQERGRLPSPEMWGTMKLPASWLGVPMLIGQQLIGVICVQSYRTRAYGEEEELLLSTIADQVAVAIEQARLYEETRRRALEQETVSRIAYALNTLDVRDAFPVLVEGLQSLSGCDAVSLLVMDETGEQFITSVLDPPFPPPVPPNLEGAGGAVPPRVGGVGGWGDMIPLAATAALESLQAGRPHLTADLSTEAHFPLERALYQAGLRSRVALPLFSAGEVFGALILGGSNTGLFREDQLPVLQQIADAVALAVENSFLFQSEREQRELAEALEEAAAAISSTLEPDQVMDRILEQVARVVAGGAFNIMLIEDGVARVVRWREHESLGVEEQIADFSIPVAEYPSLAKMAQTGKPVVVPDTSTNPDWVPLEGRKWLRSYVATPIRVDGETVGILNVDGTRPGQFGPADAHQLEAFANHAAAAIENARLFEQAQQEIAERKRAEGELRQSVAQLRRAFEGTVEVLVLAIEMRDPYTAGHQRRVTKLACAVASEMGLPEEQIRGLHMAGLIHDVGKINIPAEILSKPGTLSDLEFGLIRMHVQAGYDVLKGFDFPWPVAQIVLQHHERLDGSGYPQGLLNEEILLEARLLAVADVVTAMASHRPYRPACGLDKALEEISQSRGVLYDAEVVDVCLKLFTEERFEFK